MAEHEDQIVVKSHHHSLHENCEQYCCNGFDRMQLVNTTDIPQTYTSFLAFRICPHFDYQVIKAKLCKKNKGQVPAHLEVAMQLMTLLIESTLDMFYQILFGEQRTEVLKGTPKKLGIRHVYFTNKPTPLDEPAKDQTRRALADLASNVYIKFGVQLDSEVGGETELLRRSWWTGERRIVIRVAYPPEHNDDLAYTTWRHVNLARNFAHEFTHAVMLWKHGHEDQHFRAFFGDEVIGEEGYAFERHALGGVLTLLGDDLFDRERYYNGSAQTPSKLAMQVVLEEWPDMARVIQYIETGSPIAIRGECSPVRMIWATSMSHFLKLLTASFWATEYIAKGVAAVRFPKIHGQRIFEASDGRSIHITTFDKINVTKMTQAELEKTIPEGYHVNQGGLVMPVTETTPEMFHLYYQDWRQPPAADIHVAVLKVRTSSERRKRQGVIGPSTPDLESSLNTKWAKLV